MKLSIFSLFTATIGVASSTSSLRGSGQQGDDNGRRELGQQSRALALYGGQKADGFDLVDKYGGYYKDVTIFVNGVPTVIPGKQICRWNDPTNGSLPVPTVPFRDPKFGIFTQSGYTWECEHGAPDPSCAVQS